CPALLDPALYETEPPEAIVETRERLDQQALESALAEPHEALRLADAIPLKPPPAETPPMCPDFVHHWRDAE
ncbi:unnamed protein product, partial [Prorocentrum cordatum]